MDRRGGCAPGRRHPRPGRRGRPRRRPVPPEFRRMELQPELLPRRSRPLRRRRLRVLPPERQHDAERSRHAGRRHRVPRRIREERPLRAGRPGPRLADPQRRRQHRLRRGECLRRPCAEQLDFRPLPQWFDVRRGARMDEGRRPPLHLRPRLRNRLHERVPPRFGFALDEPRQRGALLREARGPRLARAHELLRRRDRRRMGRGETRGLRRARRHPRQRARHGDGRRRDARPWRRLGRRAGDDARRRRRRPRPREAGVRHP